MAESPTTTSVNLGSKAVDSNIIRRKQAENNQSPQSVEGHDGNKKQSRSVVPGSICLTPTKPPPFKPNDSYPFGLKSSDFTVNPNTDDVPRSESRFPPNPNSSSSNNTRESSTFGPHSPTIASPNSARKLQQVFQLAGERLHSEEKITSLVQSFETEMKKSGLEVDFSQLTAQLKFLNEGLPTSKPIPRYIEGDIVEVEDPPESPQAKVEINPTQRQGKVPNWSSLFQAQAPSKMMELEHFPDMQTGKEAVAELDESDIDTNSWNHCLIGYFLDGKMPYNLLCATARAVWKENSPTSIKQIGSCFFFVFKDEATKLQVLEEGPYFFSRRYLVLTDWRRMLVPNTAHPPSIPAWVKLHKLPLECWTAPAFSRIASTIGRPIHVDNATASKKRLDFARVCIEVSAGDDLPDEVVVKANGDSVVVRVEYQWLPAKCSECKVFGHKCKPKPTPPIPEKADVVAGKQPIVAQISDQDPLVQSRVLEALMQGGSAALDVVTAVVPDPQAVSGTPAIKVGTFVDDPPLLEDTPLIGEKGIGPDHKPPHVLVPSSSGGSGGQELEVELGGDFKLVSNRKKKKGRSNQKAPQYSKGQYSPPLLLIAVNVLCYAM